MRLHPWWLIVMLSWMFSAQAHESSDEYLNLHVSANPQHVIQGKLQLSLGRLNRQIELDANVDDVFSWSELVSKETQIKQFMQNELSILANQKRCALSIPNALQFSRQFNQHLKKGYLPVAFFADCLNDDTESLVVKYTGMSNPEHKLMINVTGIGSEKKGIASHVITANNQQVQIDLQRSNWFSVFSSYVYQGIVHIFIGIDHILFLVVMLLTSVLTYNQGRWQPKQSNRQVLKDTAWVITAFTLAHSITLSATALGWVVPSSHWVEFGIALSIVLSAVNNLWPLVTRLSYITFAFGLLHGMGFASVLGELGLSQNYTVLSILAFNVGVEVGQLVILLALLPLLFFCRNKPWYRKYGVKIGSIVIGLVAIYWSIQRF